MRIKEKNVKLVLTGVNTPRYNVGMPNQRDPEKRLIHLWIPEVLYEKFAQKAKKDGVSMSSIILTYIIEQTKNETLTPEAYERIAERIRRRRAGN